MSYSAQRMTCFALISAMESDMRAIMLTAYTDEAPDTVLPAERVEVAQDRRAKAGLRPAQTLSGVVDYLDFAHIFEALRSSRSRLQPTTDSVLDSIKNRISILVNIRNRVAHTRPMEIDDTGQLLDISDTLLAGDRSNWQDLSETIHRLESDPSYVLGLTITLPKDDPAGPVHNLPIPDFDETGFMGRKKELATVKKRLLGAYPIVSVLGDGGVGKTAIALKAAYDILEDPACPFEAIVWVTAKATILTPHEIKRVSGAIESSLGLFAAATAELGSPSGNPVEELYAYLENFRVLLILDNLETVLDGALREFLLDLPMGSKVLLTSRIALGIENPVPLEAMSHDESTALLRAVGRARNVAFVNSLDPATVNRYADKMAGHPAYIKWFVSGIQAGRRPEELVNDNGLLLDFCMSNVYEYLGEPEHELLACMQVLPGARNQAELAYLSDFSAQGIQAALLGLMTTNFVAMSHSTTEEFDTLYRLSDFARLYLDKHHPVSDPQRLEIRKRSEQLGQWGSLLSAEVAQSPFSPFVINVRDRGDVHIARLLREALSAADGDVETALGLCKESESLSPGYYEPWRVEGFIHARVGDIASASYAYNHALELAPEAPVLAYHVGEFYVSSAGDLQKGRDYLQIAAKTFPNSQEVLAQIAWAHYELNDFADAVVSAGRAIEESGGHREDVLWGLSIVGRATARQLEAADRGRENAAVEALETAIEMLSTHGVDVWASEVGDWFIAVADRAADLARRSRRDAERSGSDESYAAGRAQDLANQLCVDIRDAAGADRFLGKVLNLHPQNGYGFIQPGHHFFHMRDLVDRQKWEWLQDGVECVYSEAPPGPKGPRAAKVTPLFW